MVRYAKKRGLLLYGKGKDLYGREIRVQDGSWAMLHGVRIYAHNSDNDGTEICLSLRKADAKKLIIALKKAFEISD